MAGNLIENELEIYNVPMLAVNASMSLGLRLRGLPF